MIKDGCLQDVDEIYGYHNTFVGPVGTVCYKHDVIMAGCADVEIIIKRNSPKSDPLTAATVIHNSLHLLKS